MPLIKSRSGWSPRSGGWHIFKASTIRDMGIGSGVKLLSAGGSSPANSGQSASPTYEEIKSQCLQQESLWEDPDFPADDSSIYFKNPPSVWPGIKWKRPKEICSDPEMFVGGASRLDINQGALGDCWLLAAVSCLATDERMLHNVVPEDQSFSNDYAGIFRFRFWSYGHWVEVLIDDRLPTKNGKLIYMHSKEKNEFWSALLEKAYAKMNGTYEALSGGLTIEALTDFTGGVAARHELRDQAPDDLFQTMLKARKNGALMGCSIDAEANCMEQELPNGLLIGHAYSITDVKLMDVKTSNTEGQIPMVRVRNPWGDSHEWKGAWSDSSDEWQFVPEEEKQELGLIYSHDGEFWMSYKDFVANFQRLEICFLGPDGLAFENSLSSETSRPVKWESNITEGSWHRSVNAGGCRNYPRTFWTNPQFRVSLDDQDPGEEDGKATFIIGLMQKDRRKLKNSSQGNLVIGYCIYELPDPNSGTLDSSYFKTHSPIAKSPQYSDIREVSGVHKLPLGHYVIIPTTFEPNEEGDFILRTFSERKADELQVLDQDTGKKEVEVDKIDGQAEEENEQRQRAKERYISLAGRDGEIDAYEFMDLLNGLFPKQEYKTDGFSSDMARSMVALHDSDLTGKLGYEEFKQIWKELVLCKNVFRMLDTDGSGYFSAYELRSAFHLLGFSLSNATFSALAMRYGDRERRICFDDFISCYLRLKAAFIQFSRKDTSGYSRANFHFDDFLTFTMYS